MAVHATLARSYRLGSTESQSLEDVLDVGPYRYAAISLRVDRIEGDPTDSVTIKLQTAVEKDNLGFADLKDSDGTAISLTVSGTDDAGTVDLTTSDRLARYLRWDCTAFFSTGTNPVLWFTITLILK